jgi:aspergillopepsin I
MPPSATGNSPLYKPDKSSTAKKLQGYTYSECYGSGYCDNGVVYTDNFQVGSVVLTGQPILVETGNTQPSNGIRTGTLGLNHDSNGQVSSPSKVTTWFAALKGYLQCTWPL